MLPLSHPEDEKKGEDVSQSHATPPLQSNTSYCVPTHVHKDGWKANRKIKQQLSHDIHYMGAARVVLGPSNPKNGTGVQRSIHNYLVDVLDARIMTTVYE